MAKLSPNYSIRLRQRLVDLSQKRVLIARLDGTNQANDLSIPPKLHGLRKN